MFELKYKKCTCIAVLSLSSMFPIGKPKVELSYDKMYTVTSRLTFTVSKEDDGVPVVCIVDHPAVKDFQAQKYLEVQCKYFCSVINSK